MKKIEAQRISEKEFDSYRNIITSEFHSEKALRKKKLSQGLYWTSFDKDLANQYVREESWFLGIKIKDNIKLIDHGGDNNDKKKSVGF